MDRVLLYLIKDGGFVSGQDLAGELDISRAAVWKHIKNARESGFVITSSQKKGYKIVKYPENRIIPELIAKYFGSELPFDLIYLDSVISTNTYARETKKRGNEGNFILFAEEQTGGRGRFDRTWTSEKGKDLTFSISLNIDKPVKEIYKFTMLSGLAVLLAVRNILNGKAEISIKWPNDIIIGDRKLCGILSEIITEEMLIKRIIIGIGINVNSIPAIQQAVSLKNILAEDTDRNLLFAMIIKNFYNFFIRYENGEFQVIFREWKNNLGWLGRDVSFNDGRTVVAGKLKDIDENGAVVIETAGGDRTYYSGDLIAGRLP